jgi:hypothetical protein
MLLPAGGAGSLSHGAPPPVARRRSIRLVPMAVLQTTVGHALCMTMLHVAISGGSSHMQSSSESA